MQCCVYLPFILYFANKCLIGCLDIIEHQHLYLVKEYVHSILIIFKRKKRALCNYKWEVTLSIDQEIKEKESQCVCIDMWYPFTAFFP